MTHEILFEVSGDCHSGMYQAQLSSRRSCYIVRKRHVAGGAVVGRLLQLERLYVNKGAGSGNNPYRNRSGILLNRRWTRSIGYIGQSREWNDRRQVDVDFGSLYVVQGPFGKANVSKGDEDR